ncbi:hypothetical protein TNCV_2787251 [Trichonephila clavipes]|uniref:Uncharacterized protein n=1 Tax=Trichonephila clavipes TaxID=2585209 RepID=A0A8X6VPT4_TRICX|nr:hypothetical protein TNCV_2787251 [Trichonephila clavipes]
MPNQLVHEERAGQILDGFDGLEKDLLVLRTKNWRTLARKRPTLGCRATDKGRDFTLTDTSETRSFLNMPP